VGAASIVFKGIKEMRAKIKAIQKEFPDKIERALYKEAQFVMTAAKKVTPVAEEMGGTLRNSGFVSKPARRGTAFSVVLGFGGAAAAYATAVHEHPSGSSPPSWEGKTITFNPPGTGPKYLERPLMEAIPGMAERVAARVAKEKASVEVEE